MLHYTVPLPRETIWPPQPGQRVVLDVYHSGGNSDVGGHVEAFTATFGEHVLTCGQLAAGPQAVAPRSHRRLTIP